MGIDFCPVLPLGRTNLEAKSAANLVPEVIDVQNRPKTGKNETGTEFEYPNNQRAY